MAKHRKDDRIVEVGSYTDLPKAVTNLTEEHFERDVLHKIFENIHASTVRKYGKEVQDVTHFYLYSNEQFGDTNAFILFHTEKDLNGNCVGWIDFVMVQQSNRSEGLGGQLTEMAIDFLRDKGATIVFTSLLLPVSKDGEEGYPAYGSQQKLTEWGFSEVEKDGKQKHFTINGERYKQMVYVLI